MFKLLIIEDENEIAEELTEFLSLHGYKNIVCENSADAGLAQLQKEKFSHLLLDLRMPGLNGFDVLKSLEHNSHKWPKIAVISGHATPIDEETAKKLGAKFFFRKPTDPQEILDSEFLSLD